MYEPRRTEEKVRPPGTSHRHQRLRTAESTTMCKSREKNNQRVLGIRDRIHQLTLEGARLCCAVPQRSLAKPQRTLKMPRDASGDGRKMGNIV